MGFGRLQESNHRGQGDFFREKVQAHRISNCMLSLKFLVCSKEDRAYSEKQRSENASSSRLQGVKNNGKSLTVRLRKWSRSLIYQGRGSLQEVPTVRL